MPPEALSKEHHHRRFKWRFLLISQVAQEISKVRILSNLSNGFLIRRASVFL